MDSVDLAYLARSEPLSPGRSGTLSWSWNGRQTGSIAYIVMPGSLRLNYRTRARSEAWEHVEEDIPFAWTQTEFGGQRRWFQCPSCGRRCRIVEARMFSLFRDVANGQITSVDATGFVCDELRAAFGRGIRVGESTWHEKSPEGDRGLLPVAEV